MTISLNDIYGSKVPGWMSVTWTESNSVAPSATVANDYTDVKLNTVEANNTNITLNSNVFTFPAGVYRVYFTCVTLSTNESVCYLLNDADDSVILRGVNQLNASINDKNSSNHKLARTFKIESLTNARFVVKTAAAGLLGAEVANGNTECYSRLLLIDLKEYVDA